MIAWKKFGNILLRIIPAGCLCFWLLMCSGLATSLGVFCADDALFACVAKSVTEGKGYRTPWDQDGSNLDGGMAFNPAITVGPFLIWPVALGKYLFGRSDSIPGIVIILVWVSLIGLSFQRLAKHYPPSQFALLCVISTVLPVMSFGWHFEQFVTMLGEVAAAALILLAYCFLVEQHAPPGRKRLVLAGISLGTAINIKLIALFCMPAAFILLRQQLFLTDPPSGRPSFIKASGWLLAGICLPNIIVEFYRLFSVGLSGYASNLWQYLQFVRSQGIPAGNLDLTTTIPHFLDQLTCRFGIYLPGFFLLLAIMLILIWQMRRQQSSFLPLGLFLASILLLLYWLLLSNGWPRYMVISLLLLQLSGGVLSISLQGSRRVLLLVLLFLTFFPGAGKITFGLQAADHGLFAKSSMRLEREQVTALMINLQKSERPVFFSEWWAAFADCEYTLPGFANIGVMTKRAVEHLDNGQTIYYVANLLFEQRRENRIFTDFGLQIEKELLRGRYYILLRLCRSQQKNLASNMRE